MRVPAPVREPAREPARFLPQESATELPTACKDSAKKLPTACTARHRSASAKRSLGLAPKRPLGSPPADPGWRKPARDGPGVPRKNGCPGQVCCAAAAPPPRPRWAQTALARGAQQREPGRGLWGLGSGHRPRNSSPPRRCLGPPQRRSARAGAGRPLARSGLAHRDFGSASLDQQVGPRRGAARGGGGARAAAATVSTHC